MEIEQLKKFKTDVAEVKKGEECGLSLKKFNEYQAGDIIEGYKLLDRKTTFSFKPGISKSF